MAGNYVWKSGNDGTQYYVNTANGSVAGMVANAGNGSDIFKIGKGTEFTALFHLETNAKAAIEKTAGMALKASKSSGTALAKVPASRSAARKKPGKK